MDEFDQYKVDKEPDEFEEYKVKPESTPHQELDKLLTGSLVGQAKYSGESYPGLLQYPQEATEFMGYGEAPLEQAGEPQGAWQKMLFSMGQGENMAPGFVGTMLNPAEIASMIATGGLTAPKGQALKQMLDWGVYGIPSIAKGVKGGVKGLFEGLSAKAIEQRVPAEKALPTALGSIKPPAATTAGVVDVNRPEVLDALNDLVSTQREQLKAAGKLMPEEQLKIKAQGPAEPSIVEQLKSKYDPKYKVPWGGKFEPRNYEVTPDSVTKLTLQNRAQQLNTQAAKETGEYISKVEKMSQLEGRGKITPESPLYKSEFDRIAEENSKAIKKMELSVTNTVTSSGDLNPKSILSSEEGFLNFDPMIHELKQRGIVGSEFPNPKDFRPIYKYLQLPHDIAKSHPSFKPIFDAEMAREATRNAQIRRYYEITKPYFELSSPADRAVVDRTLLFGDKLQVNFDPVILQKLKLTPPQIEAYNSITKGTDTVLNDLAAGMQRHGVDQATITEFVTNLRNKGFIPHKWYGKYGIVVQEPGRVTTPSGGALGAPHTTRNKTIYMTARENQKEANLEFDRLVAAYPGKIVKRMKREELEQLASFDLPPYAIQALIDKAATRAGVDPLIANDLNNALKNIRLAKGMGAHFIKRKWTPGYTENLERPLAEYFMGMSGYIAKVDAMQEFANGLKYVKTPNLRKYAVEYIDSVNDPQRHNIINIAKSLMFHYHLGTNLKFGVMNLTQNAITGYPILGKHTNFPAAKYMKAMADVASRRLAPDELQAIKFAKDTGLLETRFIHEALIGKGDPFSHHGKLATLTDISSAIPNLTEDYNRVSAFVAGYRALRDKGPAGATGLPMRGTGGARVPGSLPDLAKGASDISNEIHFIYGKGDRPVAARGVLSPIMTFRLFGINYVTMLKNFMKEGEWAALARSMGVMTGLAGATGWTGANIAEDMYMHFTGQDLKTQTREWIKGKTKSVLPDEWGDRLAMLATDGLPAAVGPVNMSRSIGMGDLVPLDPLGAIGVFGGQYEKFAAGYKAYEHKDYYRMFESISPQFIQSPMSAWRLQREGAKTIAGQQVLDVETGGPIKISTPSAIMKGIGFQPVEYAEATRKTAVTYEQQQRITKRGLKAAELAAGAINRGEMGRALQIINTASSEDPLIAKVMAQHLDDWIGPKLPPLIRYQVDKAIHGQRPPNMP